MDRLSFDLRRRLSAGFARGGVVLALILLTGCGPGVARPAVSAAVSEPIHAIPMPSGKEAGTDAAIWTPSGETEKAVVVRITDGDTIVIDRGVGEERLRYIGIDTPESVKPGTAVEFMAAEAAAANESLVAGREVRLERDVSDVDQFGRLLRYVWVDDASAPSGWLMVNLALVEGGYAQATTYPPDVRYADAFLAAQQRARDAGDGLWTVAASPPATPRALIGGAGKGCDPAYPDVCIAPLPPDLDCRDVPFVRFRVLPPDPHFFDGNRDGVGCEGPPP